MVDFPKSWNIPHFFGFGSKSEKPISAGSSLSGKEIKYQFQHEKETYATEIINRMDAVDIAKDSLRKTIKHLKFKEIDLKAANKVVTPEDNAKIQEIQEKILLFSKLLEQSNRSQDTWISSNFFRSHLRQKIQEGKEKLAEAFKDSFATGLVNFRYHGCDIEGRKVGFFRFGVITDHRNGFTNLEELELLSKNEQLIQKKRAKLITLKNNLERHPQKNAAKIVSIEHAIEEISNPLKTLEQRKLNLSIQMLGLVTAQVDKKWGGLKNTLSNSQEDQQIFRLFHLGLLNPHRANLDQTGWNHDEWNEIKDMSAIFAAFKDKQLIFDGAGPCLDDKGNIHLSQELFQNDGTTPYTMSLDPIFMNVSVQGHTKNDGIQAEINKEKVDKLLEIAEKAKDGGDKEATKAIEILTNVKVALSNHKSNYQIAEDIGKAVLLLNIPYSLGCLSAKDRTGYVAARSIYYFIENQLTEKLSENPKLLKKLKRKFTAKLLDKNAAAAQVVKDNTGETVLKCSVFYLPGYSDGLKGALRRINYYRKQAAVEIKNKIKKNDTE